VGQNEDAAATEAAISEYNNTSGSAAPTSSRSNASPAAGGPALSGVQMIALNMMPNFGWDQVEWYPLNELWTHVSEWTYDAEDPESGAYGIPQALPAERMASAGADWRTNPATQIKWGLEYIAQRYGSPAAAWLFWQEHRSY
jgi:hypothetical protein